METHPVYWRKRRNYLFIREDTSQYKPQEFSPILVPFSHKKGFLFLLTLSPRSFIKDLTTVMKPTLKIRFATLLTLPLGWVHFDRHLLKIYWTAQVQMWGRKKFLKKIFQGYFLPFKISIWISNCYFSFVLRLFARVHDSIQQS